MRSQLEMFAFCSVPSPTVSIAPLALALFTRSRRLRVYSKNADFESGLKSGLASITNSGPRTTSQDPQRTELRYVTHKVSISRMLVIFNYSNLATFMSLPPATEDVQARNRLGLEVGTFNKIGGPQNEHVVRNMLCNERRYLSKLDLEIRRLESILPDRTPARYFRIVFYPRILVGFTRARHSLILSLSLFPTFDPEFLGPAFQSIGSIAVFLFLPTSFRPSSSTH